MAKSMGKRVQYVDLTSPLAQGVACPQATHSESESRYWH
jgi:hypothetical protein